MSPRTFLLWLAWLAGTLSASQALAATPLAGHYRAESGALYFHLRVADDGQVELLSAQDGSRQPLAPLAVTDSTLMGYAATGELWTVGRSFGVLMFSAGTQVFLLTPVSAATYAAAANAATPAAAAAPAALDGAAGAGGSLGGRVLSSAKSSSGGYFDERAYTFCSDGSFRFSKSTVGSGVNMNSRLSGRWQLSGGMLQLSYHEGGGNTLALRHVADDVIELGGQKYLVRASRSCR